MAKIFYFEEEIKKLKQEQEQKKILENPAKFVHKMDNSIKIALLEYLKKQQKDKK